ncbi:hypothetical protein A6R68_22332 [Neotoma lepida]|uniref:Uncharacterized protein n=1 Tax=Neotoma lepida TaxID=56216 RepID=A0A1A6I059_NEOLE|nr:hypothetical protein A6R68_22332 [Neotoma lepida]
MEEETAVTVIDHGSGMCKVSCIPLLVSPYSTVTYLDGMEKIRLFVFSNEVHIPSKEHLDPKAKRKKVMQTMFETSSTLDIQAMLLPCASSGTTSTVMDFGSACALSYLLHLVFGLGCPGGNKLPPEDPRKYTFTNSAE